MIRYERKLDEVKRGAVWGQPMQQFLTTLLPSLAGVIFIIRMIDHLIMVIIMVIDNYGDDHYGDDHGYIGDCKCWVNSCDSLEAFNSRSHNHHYDHDEEPILSNQILC